MARIRIQSMTVSGGPKRFCPDEPIPRAEGVPLVARAFQIAR